MCYFNDNPKIIKGNLGIGDDMYYLIAKKFAIPWTIISACLLSTVLYLVTGSINLLPHASAASDSSNPSTEVVNLIELLIEPQVEGNQSIDSIYPEQQEILTTFSSSTTSCAVDDRFPESVRQWCDLITGYAVKNNLDPDLIAAVIWQESGGNPTAYSKSGAVGLMQVMPRNGISASFQCPNGPCFKNRPTIEELRDPEFNISYGTGMLSELQQHHGDTREALKAYGPMDVGYYYADIILNLKSKYGD
jgi:hypothetical protein